MNTWLTPHSPAFSSDILQSQSQNQCPGISLDVQYMSGVESVCESWEICLQGLGKKTNKNGNVLELNIETGEGRGAGPTWLEVQLERQVLLSAAK